jgi:hypothetical protein
MPLSSLCVILQLDWESRGATASIILVPLKRILDILLGKGWNEKTDVRAFV